MARVVVVHGVGQEFKGPETLLASVGPSLRDGVRLAGGPLLGAKDVSCAFYGDVFRTPGTRDVDLPPWDESDVEPGFEAELLASWWLEASRVDPAVPSPERYGTSRGVVGFVASRPLTVDKVREALDALSGSRFFARVSERMLIFGLKQVRRYLTEPAVRETAIKRLAVEVQSDTRVVVAHSLGSIVAYEALCANPQWPVTALVTLGSPLGVRGLIFERLMPAPQGDVGSWPGGVQQWTNIADSGDVVAVVRTLSSRFGLEVQDLLVRNGMQMHDLTRYLSATETGAAVAAGLKA